MPCAMEPAILGWGGQVHSLRPPPSRQAAKPPKPRESATASERPSAAQRRATAAGSRSYVAAAMWAKGVAVELDLQVDKLCSARAVAGASGGGGSWRSHPLP